MLNMLQRSSRNTTRTWLPKSEPLPLARSRWQANIDHICLWIRSLKPSSNKPSLSLLTLSNIPWWINWEVQTALASSNLEGQEALVAYTAEQTVANMFFSMRFSRTSQSESAFLTQIATFKMLAIILASALHDSLPRPTSCKVSNSILTHAMLRPPLCCILWQTKYVARVKSSWN